jgi:uncharacterized protein YggE
MKKNINIKLKGGKKQMDKSVQITLIIVIGFIALAGIGYAVFSSLAPSNENTVTGNGQAVLKVTPDLVKVYFGVDTTANTSQEAKDKNAEIVDKVITELVKEGFERKDIQTENFNIYPDYSWENGKQDLKGYKATHTLVVEISTNDSDKIGTAIDAGVNAGANINYINFELSQAKQNEYKAQALKLAAEDAKIKAESIATGLNKQVGKLVSVSDNNFNYYPWRLYDNSAGASGVATMAKEAVTNIQPGNQEISASVTAIFALK